MTFNAKDFASAYVTVDEALEIKKGFDLFDRDLGGAIDPKGRGGEMQS
jgi:Ca2+-binding EF-hand superfamily protein